MNHYLKQIMVILTERQNQSILQHYYEDSRHQYLNVR